MCLNISQQFSPLVRRNRATPFDCTDSIPARGATQRCFVRPPATDPNWDPRHLDGCWLKDHFLYIVLFPLISKWLTCPQTGQYVQSLVKPPGARLGICCLIEEAKI